MSFNQSRVSSHALRYFTCLLVIAAASACAHNPDPGYGQAPRSFPGVQIIPTQSGGFSVRIMSGMVSGPPLYVVDGIRMMVDPSRGIDWLQPADILSITVLKDPSEISVYGQSGLNGVLLITTKQSIKPVKRTL